MSVVSTDEATPLQLAAESVADLVLDVNDGDVRRAVAGGSGIVGIDIIALMALIEMIMTMISDLMDNCPQNDDDLVAAIRRPSLWQRVQLRLAVRRNVDGFGLRYRSKVNKIADSCLEVGSSCDEALIHAVVDQVRAS